MYSLTDQFPLYTPYNYTMNNAFNSVDPDAKAPVPTIGAMAYSTVIGTGVDYVIQLGFELFQSNNSWSESFTNVNKTSLAISGGIGAGPGGAGAAASSGAAASNTAHGFIDDENPR